MELEIAKKLIKKYTENHSKVIQNIEIAYNLPLAASAFMGIRKARFFVRGANLATISGIKDIDPESATSGIDRYPLNRTFTGGVKLTF